MFIALLLYTPIAIFALLSLSPLQILFSVIIVLALVYGLKHAPRAEQTNKQPAA